SSALLSRSCCGGAQPVAVAAGLDDVRVEGDAIDDRGDEARVTDDLSPLAERKVGGDGDAGFLFAFGEDQEQQLGAAAVELHVAEGDEEWDGGWGDGRLGGEVAIGDSIDLRETGCGGAAWWEAVASLGEHGGEHLGEEREVGLLGQLRGRPDMWGVGGVCWQG